jgi:hypothetical protein
MRLRPTLFTAVFTLAALASLTAFTPALAHADDVSIPFTSSKLPNGLTVILHEDHSVPIVAVNITYRVGSRFEVAHRTGFAHLFEHLMFMGTQRAPTKMFDAWMEGAGGWNNADTSEDRTEFFDVAPPTALPLILWLEADRQRDLGPKFIGMISQKYRPRNGGPAASFQRWIDEIKDRVASTLVPALATQGMSVTDAEFKSASVLDSPYNLANISDFNSLIAKAQEHGIPPFALTDKEIGEAGHVLNTMKASRDEFAKVFKALAASVVKLTGI